VGCGEEVGRADAGKGADQGRVVLSCLVDEGAAPVMTAKEHGVE
jgi:hypothetical protein